MIDLDLIVTPNINNEIEISMEHYNKPAIVLMTLTCTLLENFKIKIIMYQV